MDDSLWSRIILAYGHKGWSAAELGRRANVPKQSISNIKLGRSPGPRVLPRLANALEVDPEWLRSGEERLRPNWLGGEKPSPRLNEASTEYGFEETVLAQLAEHGRLLRAIVRSIRPDDGDELIRAALALSMPSNPESLLGDPAHTR